MLRAAGAVARFGAGSVQWKCPAGVAAVVRSRVAPCCTRWQSTGPRKGTTGIVGLDVVPNAREVLDELYTKTLRDIQIIPEGVAYRTAVEAFTKYRLDVVRRLDSIEAIEDEIGVGQVEELIEQAKDELDLIPQYAEWKEWEEPMLTPEDDDHSDLAGVDEFGSSTETAR